MRKLLRDLYLGNIAPAERQITPNSDLQRELERVSRFETQFRSRLNEAECPLLDQLVRAQNEVDSIIVCENFILGLRLSNVIKLVRKEAHERDNGSQKGQKELGEGKIDSKTRRRGLRLKKSVKMGLASRDVAGGDAVTRDFGPWGASARADWKQFSPEERERIVG